MDPTSPARLEPAFRAAVNGQLYWVASAEELAMLRESPSTYSGPLRDPVTRDWFEPNRHSPRREDGSQILLFASEQTAAEFDGRTS